MSGTGFRMHAKEGVLIVGGVRSNGNNAFDEEIPENLPNQFFVIILESDIRRL